MIRVQNLEKRYGEVRALSDVHFGIERGEVVGLLGQNGAGKTTCMKLLTGYLEPTRGQVSIGGYDIIEERQRAQALIGYLPEHNPLYLEMTVEEYLRFMAELRGLKRAKRSTAIEEAVLVTGLQEHRHQAIKTLSKGYRQRVGLAQAILHKPSILILDEPTNGLDPLQIQEIRSLIKRLAQQTTILLSTHILSEIEAVCDRVLILIDGELAADSSLSDLLHRPEVHISVRGCDLKALSDRLLTIPAIEAIEEVASPMLSEADEVVVSERQGQDTGLKEEGDSGSEPNSNVFVRYLIRCKDHLSDTSISQELDAEEEVQASLVASSIAHEVSKAGWELGELTPHKYSLESAFRELQAGYITQRS